MPRWRFGLTLIILGALSQSAFAQLTSPDIGDQERRREERRESRFELPLDLPGQERLFRRESEIEVFERIRQQERQSGASGRVVFPERGEISKEPYSPHPFPVSTVLVEPGYVSHGRLYFEQRDLERHGWDLGIVTPGVTLGRFYWDVFTLPYHAGTRICQHYDTSAGKCLPGDPTPLYLYPPEFSMTGLVLQSGAIFTGAFLFP